MDAGNILASIGGSLNKAKDFTAKATKEKAESTGVSNTGSSGAQSPKSFGVNARVGAPPATMRMAGGIGLQRVASTVISKGINEFVMPAVDKQMSRIVNGIKADIETKNHYKAGNTMMAPPSVLM